MPTESDTALLVMDVQEGIVDIVTTALAIVTFLLFICGVSAVYLILDGGGFGILVGYFIM